MEFVCLDSLLSADHPYRNYLKVFDFKAAMAPLKGLDKDGAGADGYGIEKHFKFLLLQFLEDNSDREHERFLSENNAAKWFCGLSINDQTPDFSTLSRVRERIGTHRLAKVFAIIKKQLQKQGYMSEVFTFVDATKLISKNSLWRERDKLIAEKIEKLNNEVLPKVAVDKEARIGCKGKDKYWYGYKQHTSVDMQSGLINKVAVTPANTTDAKGLKHICPSQGAVYGDKGYCSTAARHIIIGKGCHDATIKKNNMKIKNKDLDKWHTKIRSPYERVFSKMNHRVRYQGVKKNQFSGFMMALCHNMRRMVVLTS